MGKLLKFTPLDQRKIDSVNTLWQPMYELAMVVCGDNEIAEVVTARCFLRAFHAHISNEIQTEAFLVDELSKVLPLDLEAPPTFSRGNLSQDISKNELHGALLHVPFIERAVFALQSCRGRSREQVAEMLNIPLESVPILASNAMVRIREHLLQSEHGL